MPEELRVEVVSPPDRENLVAQLMLGNEQWAELDRERGEWELTFYPRQDGRPWVISFDEAVRALQDAKRRLADE